MSSTEKERQKEKERDGCGEIVDGGSEAARLGVKILSDQVHIIGLVNIHSFLRYSEG